MTGMRKRFLFSRSVFILLLLLLSIVPFSFAKEIVITQITTAAVTDFYATSTVSDYAVCSDELTTDSILIRNQGNVPDTYSITLTSENGAVLDWITMRQNTVTLQPGEQQEVLAYISPLADISGPYTYTITVTSVYDDSETFEKQITVKNCPNIALNGYISSQQTCPCSVGVYIFDLANTGGRTETYSLWLEGIDSEYYDLSEYKVTLEAGEKKKIYAYVRMACFIYGDFLFSLIAETEQSGYTAEIPLTLYIQQACYNYNIALGEALIFVENETLNITFAPKQDAAYTLCQENPAVIPVSLENPSEIMNQYSFMIEDAQQWITPAEPYVRLLGNKQHITNLVVNTATADSGIYSFALKVETLRGDLETVVPFTVEIEDCSVAEESSWLKYTLIALLILVVLSILIVGYFLLSKREGTITKGKEHPVSSWIKKNKHLLMIVLPLILLLILIAAIAYPIVKEEYAENLKEAATVTTEAATVPTLFDNWLTALVLLSFFVLLALLVWYFRLRKRTQRKKDGKTLKTRIKSFFTNERWQKLKPFFKWFWVILLLLLLLSGLTAGMYFLYKNYKEDAQRYLNQNKTEVQIGDGIDEYAQKNVERLALEEQLAELQKQIAEKGDAIEKLQDEILRLAEEATQQEVIDEEVFQEKIDALLETIKQLEEELTKLYEEEAGLINLLNALDGRVSTVEDHVTVLQQQVESFEEQIAALQKIIAELSLEKVSEEVDEHVEDLEEELDALEEEKEQLEAELIEIPEIPDDSFETILAFDVSLSGQIIENGMTRFERGIDVARQYIQKDGQYSIMVVGKNAIVVQRDASSEQALHTLIKLRPLDTQSNLGKALYRAADELHSTTGRIVLISDLLTTDNTDIYAIHDDLEEQGIDIVFINLAQPSKPTLLVEEVLENATQEELLEETTQETLDESPTFTVETQTLGRFFIEIPKNAEYSLDLNTYFSDDDNDVLAYTATPGEHLTALIQKNIALLTPEKDWVGNTSIIFSADDGKGGTVSGPSLLVTIFDLETPILTEEIKEQGARNEEEQYIPWIILGTIIFLILFSLIMGAFAKKFHKNVEPPKQEENEEKKE